MPCGKVCEKLWENYLNKYGDFRERLQTIRNDQQCLMQFQLPRIKQKSFNVRVQSSKTVKKPVGDGNKCHSLLPMECCHSSLTKNNRLFAWNKTDLEKLIEAENFPDNIFPVNFESRSSIDNETEVSMTDTLHRLTSPLNSVFSKNNISHSRTQNDEGSSSRRTRPKSEFTTKSHHPAASRASNPYAQLIERLRKAEKSNLINELPSGPTSIQINTNTHHRIQKLLSFLHSLDDTTDNTLDENTIIALFSVDNHLSSSIYVPNNIQQLNIIPKTILHSLRNTSDNEQMLNQIEAEMSRNKMKELNANLLSINSNDASNFDDKDDELNSRLFHTYTIKAFKDFLIYRNKSARLPKLFHDLDRSSQN